MSAKPRVFVGSSSEGLAAANAIHQNLDRDAEVTPWQHAFATSKTYIESLMSFLDETDYAIFVLTADDARSIRGQNDSVPRDNVVFELGLFIGRLGRERVFLVMPRGHPTLKLPTDPLGVATLDYDARRSDGNLAAALNPASDKVRAVIRKLGLLSSEVKPARSTRRAHAGSRAETDSKKAKKSNNASSPKQRTSEHGKSKKPTTQPLLLLRRSAGQRLFLPYRSIRHSSAMTMELIAVDGAANAFLRDLSSVSREEVAIAYDLIAEFGRVNGVEHLRDPEGDIWTVNFEPKSDRGYLSEINLQGISADEIAELRARRILLDEQLPLALRANAPHLDMYVSGSSGDRDQVKRSPLPELFAQFRGNAPAFIARASLTSVLLLRGSGTVEHIHKLGMRIESGSNLRVDFDGERAARYSNEPRHRIKFKGLCSLEQK